MTTVAWDGKVLAVDSQATSEFSGVKTLSDKLRKGNWRGQDAAFAGVGSRAQADEIAEWLFGATGMPPVLDEDGTHGLLVVYQKAYFVEGKRPRLIEVLESPQALGSGRGVALGAMYAGRSAEDAIRIAIQVDAWTGGPVRFHEPVDTPPVEELVDWAAFQRLKVMHSDAVTEVQRLRMVVLDLERRQPKYQCIGDGCDEALAGPTMCLTCVRKMQCDRDDQLKLNATVADERARIRTSVGYYEMQGPEQLDQAFAFADVVDYFQKAVALVSSNVGAESPTLVSVLETTSRWEDPFPMEPGHEPVTDLDLIMMDRAEAYWTELGPFLLPSGDAVRP